jgi:hypothetical protein
VDNKTVGAWLGSFGTGAEPPHDTPERLPAKAELEKVASEINTAAGADI